MVTIHGTGFQTVAIFMQTGELEKSVASVNAVSDDVKDSPNKVCTGRSMLCLFLIKMARSIYYSIK